MRSRASLLLAGLLLASATGLHAQDDEWDWDDDRRPTGGYAGIAFTYGQPQGEFGEFVDQGFGGSLYYMHRLDRDGVLAIRADGSFLIYGHESYRVPLSSTIGGRILVDVNTTNSIAFLGVGPQLGVPDGTFKPYLNGFVGLSYISTSSSVEGTYSNEPFASTTNFDDATFAYGGGAGLYIPVRRGSSPISIDVGAVYRRSGEAEYLIEGGIEDNPDGTITVFPIRSDTDLLQFHLGVTIGIGR